MCSRAGGPAPLSSGWVFVGCVGFCVCGVDWLGSVFFARIKLTAPPPDTTRQDKLLQYYLNEDDPVARGQLLLDGCRVQPLRDGQTYSVKRDGESVPLFPFSITHPDSSQAYHLATTSQQETDEWMRALQVRRALRFVVGDRSTRLDWIGS